MALNGQVGDATLTQGVLHSGHQVFADRLAVVNDRPQTGGCLLGRSSVRHHEVEHLKLGIAVSPFKRNEDLATPGRSRRVREERE